MGYYRIPKTIIYCLVVLLLIGVLMIFFGNGKDANTLFNYKKLFLAIWIVTIIAITIFCVEEWYGHFKYFIKNKLYVRFILHIGILLLILWISVIVILGLIKAIIN
jgi:hypothetical protein